MQTFGVKSKRQKKISQKKHTYRENNTEIKKNYKRKQRIQVANVWERERERKIVKKTI